jgi:large subunit ribosomal protein L4
VRGRILRRREKMKVSLYSEKGKTLERKVDLPKEIFGVDPNESALRQYLHVYQTNQRVGTVSTKQRGEVSGGGRKPWRQKGTGRARHGSIRSPIWVGGGVAHGPRPRQFSLSIPKKVAQLALKSALSLKKKEEKVKVLKDFGLKEPKTSRANKFLEAFKVKGRVLLVSSGKDLPLKRSFRNLSKAEVVSARNLNAFDVVLAEELFLFEEALLELKKRLLPSSPDKAPAGKKGSPSQKGKKKKTEEAKGVAKKKAENKLKPKK